MVCPAVKLSKVSPTVGVSLLPQANGATRVVVKVAHYRTIQSSFMFIPIGPKRLVGRSEYLNLLQSLKQELGTMQEIDNPEGEATIDSSLASRLDPPSKGVK